MGCSTRPSRAWRPRSEGRRAVLDAETTGEPIDLSVTLRTGPSPPTLRATFRPGRREGSRRLPADLPRCPGRRPPLGRPRAASPALRDGGGRSREGGGGLLRPRRRSARPATRSAARGATVGPDLSKLAGRDPATVYREIAEPGAVIRPEYRALHRRPEGRPRRRRASSAPRGPTRSASWMPRASRSSCRGRKSSNCVPAPPRSCPSALPAPSGEARMRDLLTFLLRRPRGGRRAMREGVDERSMACRRG